ncbi:MAG: dephospho-CoA kinase [Chloroflexota bacterium]|nr:dephospho-CoA kinase [Chloroflexota bacterium]MDE2931935.1 dephospho-CoA kinase [Chloroflexota bacterium]
MSDGLQGAGRRREAPVVGITGNIGTGKSTVAKFLAELGVHVVDADQVVHDLYRDSDSLLVQAVAAEFGGEVLAQDGSLDRAALGRVVFNDAAALEKLELIVHPAVVTAVRQELDRTPAHIPCAIEAIKLIESDLVMMLDAVWVVVATSESQRERLSAKGMSPAESQRRLDMQPSVEDKVARLRQKRGPLSPVTRIDNVGTLADLKSTVRGLWSTMQATIHDTKEY